MLNFTNSVFHFGKFKTVNNKLIRSTLAQKTFFASMNDNFEALRENFCLLFAGAKRTIGS